MTDYLSALVSIFALGIITTVQPCPLSVNFSILTLITGAPYDQQHFYRSILGFVLGYLVAFIILALAITHSALAIPALSLFLQHTFSPFVGPLLVLVGMILNNMINLNKYYKNLALMNNLWLVSGAFLPSFLLGGLLALSFCPSTASIFFGVMVPFTVRHNAPIVLPLVYASGAIMPLLILSILVRKGLYGLLPKLWIDLLPQVTGWILIFIGVFMTISDLYL